MKLSISKCRIAKFIITEQKRIGRKQMSILNEKGDYVGFVNPLHAYQSIEFSICGIEILARRHGHHKAYYDLIKEGRVIGRFFKSGSYQSDVDFFINGQTFNLSIFSNAGFKTAKIFSHGSEIGMLSSKPSLFKTEYGLAINHDQNIELILSVILLHIQYEKNIVLSDYNIFV